jgi:hypothetical protein
MPSWVKATIDEWAREASITQGRIFRRIHKGGYVNGDRVSAQAVADVVREYAEVCGFGDLADVREAGPQRRRWPGPDMVESEPCQYQDD